MNYAKTLTIAGFKVLLPAVFFAAFSVSNAMAQDGKSNDIETLTFRYTGTMQTFTVPENVTSLQIELAGAAGGQSFRNGYTYGAPGLGGKVQAILDVKPGTRLAIYTGGSGEDGAKGTAGRGGYNGGADGGIVNDDYAGGGGGGASDIRLINGNLKERLIVAGGGGASGKYGAGGNGGGLQAANGYGEGSNATGGGQQKGGMSGCYFYSAFAESGLFGKGGSSSAGISGGGGGGGWYGGGGGALGDGGGGSSYTGDAARNVTHIQGCNKGDGYVIIKWKKQSAVNVPVKNETKAGCTLRICPNPSPGYFYIQMDNDKPGKAEMCLQLANGATFFRKSFELKSSNALLKYYIPGRVPGIYFVTVTTESGKKTGRVVVE